MNISTFLYTFHINQGCRYIRAVDINLYVLCTIIFRMSATNCHINNLEDHSPLMRET